jgi:uncharacterized membrane protein YdjX (TVP38/TMEM64 family)
MKKYLAFFPVGIIFIAMIAFFFSNLRHQVTFQNIQIYHEIWKDYAQTQPFLSAVIFIGILTLSTCLVIPDSILLGILAGFLFPLPLAVLYISFAETLGAYLFYEAIGIAFIPPLHKRKKSFIWTLEEKIQENQISYLLFSRFTHIIPFWLINTAAACFEIKRRVFLWTTFLGVLPFSYVLAQGGAGLGTFLETNTAFSLSAIFNDKVKLALLTLGILALIPILWKIFKRKHHKPSKR